MHEGSKKAILAAFLANLGIAIAKFIGFLITGASSMLAESIHSLADTTNQGLLVLGGKQAARPATPEHPFGYGRDRYFWAFVVAMVLFLVGGLFAIYEGIQKLRDPHEITSPGVAFAILGVAVVLELFSLRTAVREARPFRGSRSWVAYIRRSKSPELPVVLLEDLGALLGLLFALTGLTLTEVTGDAAWDGAATLFIGLLLVAIAAILVVEMKSLLIGESATPEHEADDPGGHRGDPRRARADPHAHAAPGPRRAAGGRQDRPAPGPHRRPASPRRSTPPRRRVRAAVPIARVIYLEPDLREPAPQAPGSDGT